MLISKEKLFDDVVTFNFQPEVTVQWEPGQYFHYVLNHENSDDRGLERWFTISSAPFENQISITTRFAEKGSSFKNALNNMNIGDTIDGDGPEGDFILGDLSKNHVFIAGGIGITPFRSMLVQLMHEGLQINCNLLYANRDENYVFYDELQKISESQNNFKIHKFTGDERIEEKDLTPIYPDLNEPIYYVSGPKPMVEHYEKLLIGLGVEKANIKLDDFPGYEDVN